jgi:hypothetical protein
MDKSDLTVALAPVARIAIAIYKVPQGPPALFASAFPSEHRNLN